MGLAHKRYRQVSRGDHISLTTEDSSTVFDKQKIASNYFHSIHLFLKSATILLHQLLVSKYYNQTRPNERWNFKCPPIKVNRKWSLMEGSTRGMPSKEILGSGPFLLPGHYEMRIFVLPHTPALMCCFSIGLK